MCKLKFPGANKISDIQGRTPLHLAAFANDAETVKVLLQHGANAETADNQVLAFSR